MTGQTATMLPGIAAAPGVAVGPTFHLRVMATTVEQRPVADSAAELARFAQARAQAREELTALREKVAATAGADEAFIFEAHLVFLEDPTLYQEIEAYCLEQQCNIEAAIAFVFDQYSAMFRQSDDAVFQSRAADLQDIKQRLLRILLSGSGDAATMPQQPCVILAREILPSDAAMFDRAQVLGFGTAEGGPTSHVAILARGLGLPAVVGLGTAILDLPDATSVIIDGTAGEVHVRPSETLIATARVRARAEQAQRAKLQAAAQQQAVTRDNVRIEVVANVGSVKETVTALENGAEGVGLLRTEFLFVDRSAPPSEMEQLAQYRACAEALGPRPLIIRTLDIGADKPAPYVSTPAEGNPALGVRGVRLMRAMPDLLKTQLRAIWRIGPGHDVKVMFPMVTSIDEIHWLRQVIAEVEAEVRQEGHSIANRLDIGIMVEVPTLAMQAEQAIKLVDFLSIGTNDLTQYALAVDRTNAGVHYLSDALHPGVLRLIAQIGQAARAAGKWAGVCGELAGDPLAVPLLIGLGITELSMSPALIPAAKALIRQISLTEAQALAQHALTLETAQDVRAYLATVSATEVTGHIEQDG